MDYFEEIKALIQTQGTTWQAFATKDAEWKRMAEAEFVKLGRPAIFASGGGSDDREMKAAFAGFLRKGIAFEAKAGMGTDVDPQGGYLVPSYLDARIEQVLANFSPLRRLARVVEVAGEHFSIPIMKTRPAASWAGERTARTETTSPDLALVTPPSGDLYSSPALTQRLLDDSAFDAESWIVDAIGQQFALSEGAAFVTGSGLAQPMGFLTFAQGAAPVTTADATRAFGVLQYVPTGQSGAFATTSPADALIELLHSLSAPYRVNASFLVGSDALRLIRQFKTASTLEYIWQPAAQAGQPSTLFGLPVYECPDMPTIAASSYSVAVGDWQRAYCIVDRLGTRMLRDNLTSKPNVLFYTWRRTGGALVDSNAVKVLKFSAS
jgi:HK97 family phage major capsid protein